MFAICRKRTGVSIVWGSICCEDHFEWYVYRRKLLYYLVPMVSAYNITYKWLVVPAGTGLIAWMQMPRSHRILLKGILRIINVFSLVTSFSDNRLEESLLGALRQKDLLCKMVQVWHYVALDWVLYLISFFLFASYIC